jgi:nitrogen fixation/metabolism regulation signal transduction histidine kinase
MFGGLAIAPLLLVFAFSVTFLTRGIDSWFHAEVRQGLTDALGLSRAALDLRMREYLDRTSRMAARLDGLEGSSLYLALDEELRSSGAEELIVTSAGGQSIAYSRAGMLHALPAVPPEELLLQLRQGRPHVSLQPAQGGGYQVLAATPIRAGRARKAICSSRLSRAAAALGPCRAPCSRPTSSTASSRSCASRSRRRSC